MLTWTLAAQVESIDQIADLNDAALDDSDERVAAQVTLAKKQAAQIAKALPKSDQYAVSLSGKIAEDLDPVQADEPRDQINVSVGTSVPG